VQNHLVLKLLPFFYLLLYEKKQNNLEDEAILLFDKIYLTCKKGSYIYNYLILNYKFLNIRCKVPHMSF